MRTVTALLITAGVLAACTGTPAPGQTSERAVDRLRVEVLEVLRHDPEAFTQGLELHGDTLFEGTGLVGESSVRAGPLGAAPPVRVDLPPPLFGEGITVVGSRLWQLTWKGEVAVERDRDTLAELRRVEYSGEGWGLCHQPERGRLVMSDGSAELTFRDPRTFAETGSVRVAAGGQPVTELNELECVGDTVYANVWRSDRILRIDPGSGEVTAEIDASGLLDPAERAEADVLNGIAAVAGTDQLLLTGKLWPKMFRVRLVASG
ncbi:glutaminyl-peptide cyclotransferase [Amycolatopsis cihanbeyliensis]|uniref:Glutamine cyclotransferase n=1 Tax=Amycolatopsis cihanbeyliensis TaxID=1128664 RepID=A0A542DIG6_AMYCI|nr:glutaminyl-peptide cyclotransferase [Amycolatopsis cihanbeyliensis]TQJ02892.1 glutamine cyclotransferase [Amycolatopsis cihanbeyliensis]